jgi:hypothetical protein
MPNWLIPVPSDQQQMKQVGCRNIRLRYAGFPVQQSNSCRRLFDTAYRVSYMVCLCYCWYRFVSNMLAFALLVSRCSRDANATHVIITTPTASTSLLIVLRALDRTLCLCSNSNVSLLPHEAPIHHS